MKFSIIVPTFNPTEADLVRCVLSAQNQNYPKDDYEILLIDDCSTNWLDRPIPKADGFVNALLGIRILKTIENGGPGAARNIGLNKAKGEWIIFVDSDDEITFDALTKLSSFIDANDGVDVIGYGFTDNKKDNLRKDGEYLSLPRHELLKKYLSLHMDGSVIFTAIKRELIEINDLRFRDGYHEDVDFLFAVFYQASKTAYMNEVIYIKNYRVDSIIHHISTRHIDGFIQAWENVGRYILDYPHELYEAYKVGIIGVVATRAREIVRYGELTYLSQYLYRAIHKKWYEIILESKLDTQYARVAKEFISTGHINEDTFKKNWSCTDLQGSLFLAPQEVRTCCKRFFVDGEIRGDVKLVDATEANPDSILSAKQSLLDKINKDEQSDCSGCPFLEFKEWQPLQKLEVKYLSLEHHSVCNMKCAYCDDTYYGGKKAEYDVKNLVIDLIDNQAINEMHTVVWGGGESTIGKDFEEIAEFIKDNTMAKQRILTNALKFSKVTYDLLNNNAASIVTSIDAGTQETFTKVRGMGKLDTVLTNLKKYSEINPHSVTIKYIMTEDNSNIDELSAYVLKIQEFDFMKCNFQISMDFKQESASFEQICNAMLLHRQLNFIGCKVVFIDDLAMQRINQSVIEITEAENFYQSNEIFSLTENPFHYKRVVIFGIGAMTDWMIENSFFIRCIDIVAREQYIECVPVLICGSQSYGDNYRRALAMGVPEESIIKGVIL